MEQEKRPLVKTIFGMMMNPSGVIKDAFANRWYFSAAVSALAFGLFFLQTGIDLYKTGQKGANFLILSAGTGLAYGLVVIPILGMIVWLALKATKTDKGIMEAVSAFCLSYSGALVYGIIGLIFSLALGWKTSVAFGVTGVLWAIGPMMFTIRELSGGKNSLSVPIASLVGALVLVSWSVFGNM